MRKKLVKLLFVLIIAIFSMQLEVQAAVIVSTDQQVQSDSGSVTISVNSKQTLGAFTLKLTDAAGLTLEDTKKGSSSFELSADKKTITGSSSEGITNLGSFTFKVPTVTRDTTYRIQFSITGMETTNLETIADEINAAVLTVTVPPVEEKSKEARLKTFGMTPNDFSGFSKNRDKEVWDVEVPNNVTKVKVYGTAMDSKATVKGTGDVTLKEGLNSVKVIVIAEAGNTKTYTLNITRKAATDELDETETSEVRLKNLGIKPKEYDFSGFKKDTTKYSVEVPNELEEIEVYAEAVDSKAKIIGTGKTTLKEGLNTIVVQVTSDDGKVTQTYTLEVTRTEKTEVLDEADKPSEPTEEPEVLGLETLQITGITLNSKFDTEKYEYKVELVENIDSLEITAKSNMKSAKIEIIGNENLKQGENTITILVTNPETEEVATYQIVVNKNIVVVDSVGKVEWMKPSTWGVREIVLVSVAVVLLIVIMVAIILKVRLAKSVDIKVEFPGAEELDRALAEHQELTVEEQDFSVKEDATELRVEEKAYYDDAIQYGRTKRKGKHF